MRTALHTCLAIAALFLLCQCESDEPKAEVKEPVATKTTTEPAAKTAESAYRFAIGYYANAEEALAQGSDDWGHYSAEAMEANEELGVVFVFPTADELQNVALSNAAGEPLETLNVQGYFDENGPGYVVVEEGRAPAFVAYNPSVGTGIRTYFEE